MPTKCKDPLSTVHVQLADLSRSMRDSTADVPHLEIPRLRLEAMLDELSALSLRQSELEAARQTTTRRIHEVTDQACKLGNFLKVGLKEHYGTRNEKLVQFGLQPFRRRRRRSAVPEEPEVQAEPSEPSEPSEPDAPLTGPEAPERNTP